MFCDWFAGGHMMNSDVGGDTAPAMPMPLLLLSGVMMSKIVSFNDTSNGSRTCAAITQL
jgi:hypothetical protein